MQPVPARMTDQQPKKVAMNSLFFPDASLALECVERGSVERKIRAHGGGLMMVEVWFCAGGIGAMHSHPHEQVTYCLSGAFEFAVAGQKQVIRAGDSLYVPAGAEHGTRCLEAGRVLDVFTPQREDFLKN